MLSTAGEAWLGGDDCDSEIAAALRSELRLVSGEGGAGCSEAELRLLARALKEQLSVSRRAELPQSLLPPPSRASPAAAPPAAATDADAATNASATASAKASAKAMVTRLQLEEWCAPLLLQMREPVMRAAAQAQVPLHGMFGPHPTPTSLCANPRPPGARAAIPMHSADNLSLEIRHVT